jgi:hypothetical protein
MLSTKTTLRVSKSTEKRSASSIYLQVAEVAFGNLLGEVQAVTLALASRFLQLEIKKKSRNNYEICLA